ncbi:MAG: hypothetical protein FWF51_02975 [Chitinivibrionia bacterium]|nr:hypothetical protein [Chitinivibrionia bacterium]
MKFNKKRKEAASGLFFNLCITVFGGAFLINVFGNEGKVLYALVGFGVAAFFCILGFIFVEEERSE